ncbi:outer membrane protein assembly factor BamD [Planctomycetota bacterium]
MLNRFLFFAILITTLMFTGCQTPAQKEEVKKSFLEQGDKLFKAGRYKEAFDYYEEGIPFIPYTARVSRAGEYISNKRMRILQTGADDNDNDDQRKISIDTLGEECFYKAMDCQIKIGNYNYVLSQYERYLDYFPNYSRMDSVVSNIKFFISKYKEWGKPEAAVRGYKLLLQIDRFSRDGRYSYFAIADYYYNGENFPVAIEYFKDIKLYFPDDKRIPEVLFKIGVSYFRDFSGIYYDFTSIEMSKRYFLKYLETKDTAYKEKCEKYLALITEKKAERIFYKGEFYLRKDEYVAAKKYFEIVKNEYKNTPWAKKAVQKLIRLKAQKR